MFLNVKRCTRCFFLSSMFKFSTKIMFGITRVYLESRETIAITLVSFASCSKMSSFESYTYNFRQLFLVERSVPEKESCRTFENVCKFTARLKSLRNVCPLINVGLESCACERSHLRTFFSRTRWRVLRPWVSARGQGRVVICTNQSIKEKSLIRPV